MRVDPETNRVTETLLNERFSSSVTLARGVLWVAGERTLIGLDAHGDIVRQIRLPRTVIDLASLGGEVWGTAEYGSTAGRVLEIDPSRGRVMRTLVVGPTPVAVTVGMGAVWVANFNGPSVTRVASP